MTHTESLFVRATIDSIGWKTSVEELELLGRRVAAEAKDHPRAELATIRAAYIDKLEELRDQSRESVQEAQAIHWQTGARH